MSLTIRVAWMTFIFQGITFPLGSAMLLEIANTYSVNAATVGYLLSLNFIGGGLATFSGSYLLRRLRAQKLLYVGIGFSFLSVISITVSTCLSLFALGMVAFGIGTWLLIVVGNYLIVNEFEGTRRSSQLNLANFFFSLAALTAPAFCGYALQSGIRWEYIFWTPFLLLFIMLIMVQKAFSGEESGVQIINDQSNTAVREKWGINVYLAAAALCFYCIYEVSFVSWIVVHLREGLARDIVAASMILTVFYMFHALGRFISGVLVKYLALSKYILFCTLTGFIGVSLIVHTTNYTAIAVITALMAISVAGLYPSILAYGTFQVKEASTRMITFFMATGLAGALAGLIISSYLKQSFGVLFSLGSGAIALLMTGTSIIATMRGRKVK